MTRHEVLIRTLKEKGLELERLNRELADREARLRAIFDAEPECVKLLAADGSLLEMNPAGLRMIEADSFQQVASQSLAPLIGEAHRPAFRELTERVFRGESGTLEYQMTGLKGGRRWLETHATPLRDATGAITALLGITRDITDRKRAEEELRQSEAKFRLLAEESPAGVVIIQDARFKYVNPALADIMGHSREELLAVPSILDLVAEADRPLVRENLRRRVEGEVPHIRFTFHARRKDGSLVDLDVFGSRFMFEGRPAVMSTVSDVTAQREAEAALRDSEERFREMAETIDDVFWMSDPASERMLYVSPGYEKIWGRSCQGLYDRPEAWLDTIHPADRDRVEHAVSTRLAGGTSDDEYRIVRPDGEVRWVRDRAFLVRNATGQVERVVGVARDVHERKTAEEELQRREERFRVLIEHAADMIGVIDHQGMIRFLSPSATNILGYPTEDVIGRSSLEFVHPADVPHTTAALRKAVANPATAVSVEYRVHRRDGQWRTLQTIGRSIPDQAAGGFIVLNSRDITDSRHIEEQLRQSQKMEAIGQLAGGIAHDFNNLLTVINGTADLALSNLNAGDPLRADLSQVLDAGERAASLTRQLLAFGRQQILMPDVLDLNAVVSDMQRMLQRLIGEHIEFVFKPEKNLASVRADPSQIEQVVVNLVVNARDAMRDGGVLTIETHNVVLDAAFAATHPSVEPGPHVMLSVADTGIGMDTPTTKKIFEPFFTTKGPTQNTGLGLATVYGIVKQSGGSIWVDSEPGRGTTFTIYLPRVEAETGNDRSTRSAMAVRGTETILIVEDEAAVRNLAARFLQSAGYTVVTAGTGAEALRLLEGHEQPVHLMLTDVVMPGMSGRELAARLASIWPRMRVLYTSGYTDDTILRHGVLGHAAAFIGKPYSKADLSRKVRDVLDAPDI